MKKGNKTEEQLRKEREEKGEANMLSLMDRAKKNRQMVERRAEMMKKNFN